jgi:hypothetical protein
MQGRSPFLKGSLVGGAMILGLSALLLLQPGISTAQGSSPAAATAATSEIGPPTGYGSSGSSLSGVPLQSTVVNPTAFWREISRKAGHYNGIPEYAPTSSYIRSSSTGKTNIGNTTNFSSPNSRTPYSIGTMVCYRAGANPMSAAGANSADWGNARCIY